MFRRFHLLIVWLACPLSLHEAVFRANAADAVNQHEYRLIRPQQVGAAVPFSGGNSGQIVGLVPLNSGNEIVVAEGGFLEPGLLYQYDLESDWLSRFTTTPQGICSLVSVPQRNEVITSSWDSIIRFYDAASIKELAQIPVDRSAARLAVTPDGSMLTIINEGFADRDVSEGRIAWSVNITRRAQQDIYGKVSFRGFRIAVAPDGKEFAICGGLFEKPSGGIAAWNMADESLKFESQFPSCLFTLAYSNDGQWLVAAGDAGTVCVDAKTGKQRATVPITSRVLQVLPENDHVLVADRNGALHVLHLPDLESVRTIPERYGPITAMTLMPDGKSLVTATRSGLQRYDISDRDSVLFLHARGSMNTGDFPVLCAGNSLVAIAQGKELWLCDAGRGMRMNSRSFPARIQQIVANEQQDRLGIVLEDRSAHAVDVLTGSVERLGEVPMGSLPTISQDLSSAIVISSNGAMTSTTWAPQKTRTAPPQNAGTVTSVKLSNDGQVCCGYSSGDVIVYSSTVDKVIQRFSKVADKPITCLDWSSEHRRLAIGEKSGRLSVLDVDAAGKPRVLLRQALASTPTAITQSAISNTIAVGMASGALAVLSADGTAPIQTVAASSAASVTACLFLDHEQTLLSRHSDGALRRTTLRHAALAAMQRFQSTDGTPIHSACFNEKADECFIAVGRNIDVRSTATWDVKQVLKGHRDTIQRVRLSPDGKTLASTGEDSLVCIRTKNGDQWDIDRTIFLPARAHRLEWSPDGRWLLLGTVAREINIFDTESWELARTLSVPFIPNTIAFSRDQSRMASSGVNLGDPGDLCQLQAWDTSKWKQSVWSDPKTYQGHRHGVEAIAMTDDGKHFYSVSADSELIDWTTDTGANRKVRNLPMSGTSLSLLPNPRFAIASWHFANLGVLDLTDGSVLLPTEGHIGGGDQMLMRDVVVSADGRLAISCAAADLGVGAGSVRVWRIGERSDKNAK